MSKASPADIMPIADVMARLRDPETGCPWDVEQDFASIAPYTICLLYTSPSPRD